MKLHEQPRPDAAFAEVADMASALAPLSAGLNSLVQNLEADVRAGEGVSWATAEEARRLREYAERLFYEIS